MLSENASFLYHHSGERVRDWQKLFQFELLQAMGHGPMPVLDSNTDITVNTPGLPLTFSRYFSSSIAFRHQDGPLGKGWSHSWQLMIHEQDDGDVIVNQANSRMRFEPSDRGGYFSAPGVHMQLSKTGDVFTLATSNGTAIYFREDGKLDYVEDLNGNQINAEYINDELSFLTHSCGSFLAFEYDHLGNITRISDHTGNRDVQYSYEAEQLSEVLDISGRSTGYDYSDHDTSVFALETITTPSGMRRNFAYDSNGRLDLMSYNDNAPVRLDYHIGRVSFTAEANNSVQKIYYDADGHIIKSISPLLQVNTNRFDGDGNLIKATGPDGSTVVFDYDENGNPVKIVDSLEQPIILNTGPFNRVTRVTDPQDNKVSYAYDSKGNLTGQVFPDETSRSYFHDDKGALIQKTNRRGGTIEYTRNSEGQVIRKQLSGGNTSEMMNPDGNILNSYAYTPFGKTVLKNESVENTFTFVGQYGVKVTENDLIYMRNRFYSPSLGRFLTEDPIAFAGGDINFYRYVLNDPVNWVDPLGLLSNPLHKLPSFTDAFPDSNFVAPTADIIVGGLEAGAAIASGIATGVSFIAGPEFWAITMIGAPFSIETGFDAYNRISSGIERLGDNLQCP